MKDTGVIFIRKKDAYSIYIHLKSIQNTDDKKQASQNLQATNPMKKMQKEMITEMRGVDMLITNSKWSIISAKTYPNQYLACQDLTHCNVHLLQETIQKK